MEDFCNTPDAFCQDTQKVSHKPSQPQKVSPSRFRGEEHEAAAFGFSVVCAKIPKTAFSTFSVLAFLVSGRGNLVR